ncbi:isochorismate synthase [Uliginosibacterium sp. H3]|uniref:isochorismate synthase n=1 Tax=Uliginosibacterium silvisoli TaxID=3114758 RepID=A0ABU6K2H7_9RHOO|nr:isochorismate synthase [Uliginosibacterium sp. H3]
MNDMFRPNTSRPYPSGFGSSPNLPGDDGAPGRNAFAVLDRQAQRSDALFERYVPGSSLFASPRNAFLTHGASLVMPAVSASSLAWRAAEFQRNAQREGHSGLLMGAVPFQLDAPAHLFSPARVERAAGVHSMEALPVQRQDGVDARRGMIATPTPRGYEHNVGEAVARIKRGELEKVVMSRALKVDTRIDLPALLRTLACRNTRGYTYAIDLAGGPANEPGKRRTLIGASPELLVARHGRLVASHPLAGSIPRSADPVEDARRAEGLLASAKDLHEHALVVDAVAAALQPYCRELIVPKAPSLVSTATMWHLATEVKGDLADPATTSLELALALHPTPAVCGYPTADARNFINEVEGFDRGFFTGLVGWCDAEGNGEWAVTIRCAVVDDDSATLYAGAGIVGASDPSLELAETSAKLRTMLGAMGLEAVLETLS